MDLKELVNKYPGYFIVNYDDFEVIYSEGYENENGLWCYKISDLEKKPEVVKPVENNVSEEQTQNEENSQDANNSQAEDNATANENSENT